MPYVFKGKLCGLICAECPEPLAEVTLRLYRLADDQNVAALAVANAKDTFAILTDDAVAAKASLLIAETQTDAQGNFVFELDEQGYAGAAFEVDVYCGNVPRRKIGPNPPKPVQFSITTLQPRWRQTESGFLAIWEYCLPYRFWCLVLSKLDIWTICGRVLVCDSQIPVQGARVRAFDADWLQSDDLGLGITGPDGRFIITYTSADFKKTPFIGIDIELFGGPDLYFRIESPDGATVLYQEPSSRGRDPDRENAGNCFCVELCVPRDKALIGQIDLPTEGDCAEAVLVPICSSSGRLLGIAITGSAGGPPFTSYTLSYSYGVSGPFQTAVVYPDCSRPPASTTSTVPVIGGTLGWLDAGLLPFGVTDFTIHLEVSGTGSTSVVVSRTFTLKIKAVEITAAATVNAIPDAEDPFNPGSFTKLIKATDDANIAVPELSIGGAFSVSGSAFVHGCGRKISQFVLAQFPVSPASPVPDIPNATGGTPLITPVVYDGTTTHPDSSGCGIATPNFILNGNLVAFWSVENCSPPPSVPKVKPVPFWDSSALNGRFVILLEVQSVPEPGPGPSAFESKDQVVVWIDNKTPDAQITKIGGLGSCIDLHLKDYVGSTVEIRGIAWDPPIDPAAPRQTPNENFGEYSLSFQKNGGVGGGIPAATPNTRVPNEWPVRLSPDGVLAQWDVVNALDASSPTPTPGIPAAAKLARGQRCAYLIALSVSDTTHVGDSGIHHSVPAYYAINVINDIP